MTTRNLGKALVWARRITQTACLVLFLALLWKTRLVEGETPSAWLKFFFDLDPLVALSTWVAAGELPSFPILALLTIGATLLLGRVFCGWVCPLGAVHQMATWIGARSKSKTARYPWIHWQRVKYGLLAGLLVMSLFGAHWTGVFDPLPLLYRSVTTALYSGTQYLVEDGATAIYVNDPAVAGWHVKEATEPVYQALRGSVFQDKGQAFHGGTLILLLFASIVLLNLYRPRFWCRYCCPLGGLLGLCAQRPVVRLKHTNACNGCGRCAMQCPSGADPDKANEWRATECFGCWNCVAACNRGAVNFGMGSPAAAPSQAPLGLSRRFLLSSVGGGFTGLMMFRLSPQSRANVFNPGLIRPPGARDEREFMDRCQQCGVCMKACPTNGLQPTLFEAGIEGIWTPMLVPKVGYCAYSCNLCGQVCPTQAIEPMTLDEKNKVKIGLASFDTGRCLPYAYGRECMICEEHCPVSPKAIYVIPTEVKRRDGSTIMLKQPHVDPDKCTGCGICENVCIFKDQAAIRITSANETRHAKNRPFLPGQSGLLPAPPAQPPVSTAPPAANPYGS